MKAHRLLMRMWLPVVIATGCVQEMTPSPIVDAGVNNAPDANQMGGGADAAPAVDAPAGLLDANPAPHDAGDGGLDAGDGGADAGDGGMADATTTDAAAIDAAELDAAPVAPVDAMLMDGDSAPTLMDASANDATMEK